MTKEAPTIKSQYEQNAAERLMYRINLAAGAA